MFGQRKSLFQAPAPSKHPLQRNTEKNDFRPAKITFPSPCPCPFLWSEISNPSVFQPALEFTVPDCPSQFLARIIVCSSHEASKSGHMLGIYVNLIVFFSSLSFCVEIELKDVPILNANTPPFYTTSGDHIIPWVTLGSG